MLGARGTSCATTVVVVVGELLDGGAVVEVVTGLPERHSYGSPVLATLSEALPVIETLIHRSF